MQYHFHGATYEHDPSVVPVSEGQVGGQVSGGGMENPCGQCSQSPPGTPAIALSGGHVLLSSV